MRPCAIVKPLALFLGALSVVAHSLPERRSESEINIRAPGGYKFSDPLTKPKDVDGNINKDVGDLKQLLKGLGLALVSEDILDGKIYTGTYSMFANTTFPKPDTTLRKRNNMEGARCGTLCQNGNADFPDSNDCAGLYQTLFSMSGQFTVDSKQVLFYKQNNCGAYFINNSPETVTYDFWDFGGTAQWLNGECVMRRGKNFAGCVFGGDFQTNPYIAVVHPSYFGL